MKKNKKQDNKALEFVLGEKIRDVQINEKQHFLLFSTMLILVNIILVASVWFVLVSLKDWYYWVLCFTILGLCFWLSLKTFREIKHFNRCEIFENGIVVNSIWFNIKVNFKDIYEMNVKQSVLDKIFKINTESLEIKLLNRRKKFTLHFIEENVVNLKQEITMLIDKASSKDQK